MPTGSLNNEQERGNLEAVEKMKFRISVVPVDEPSADSPPGRGVALTPANQARQIEPRPLDYVGGLAPEVDRRPSLGASDYPHHDV